MSASSGCTLMPMSEHVPQTSALMDHPKCPCRRRDWDRPLVDVLHEGAWCPIKPMTVAVGLGGVGRGGRVHLLRALGVGSSPT